MTNPHRLLERRSVFFGPTVRYADVAQLVERWLPKPKVAGSRPVVRFPGTKRNAAVSGSTKPKSIMAVVEPSLKPHSCASSTQCGRRPARPGAGSCGWQRHVDSR
jgi:hypothetical protein